MSANSTSRRRSKLSYSLRTLLVVMLLVGCGLSWLTVEMERASKQRQAIVAIRSLGGKTHYDDQPGLESYRADPLIRGWIGDDFLRPIRRVSIHNARDSDLEYLKSLPKLRDLRLNSRGVTDDGLSNLRGLRHLKRLDLWCERVTDRGLGNIAELENLESLDLFGTQVTDAGLAGLQDLKNLHSLKLRNTKVTSAGAESLRQALPECEVLGLQ